MSDYIKKAEDITFITVCDGYRIKRDLLRKDRQFTVIGPNGRIGPDVASFETALDLVDGDRQGLTSEEVIEAIG